VSGESGQPIVVRVDYDFASSLCFVAHRAMQRLAPRLEELRIALRWSPLDLTRITGWQRGATVDDDRRANVLRVSEELGIPVRMPRIWLDSRRAHAVALTLSGAREEAWREAVWTSIFEAGRWPDDELTGELARELGIALEEDALLRGAAELEERTRRAYEQEVTGVPNFMLGSWPFGGIQTDETMLSILGRYASRQRESSP
jgi:predicted DsbA family dithiol-disulfide isomerase